jgi:A/G-specific adenine glycosylase
VASVANFTDKQKAQFQRRLLAWYARHQRAMPWRGLRDPYRIWLSEVMLQQTRVAVVEPYYRRFIARFPTVGALARARPEEVLRLWAGLGYYRRARNLHAAAREIVRAHDGEFPRTYEGLRKLPGVGDYTAAAIASIAFHQRHAVLDGNVARLLARLLAMRGDLRALRRWARLRSAAQAMLPAMHKARPGDWNQAMMELGATVCTPRSPACTRCPVAGLCAARRLRLTEQIPEKRKKKPVQMVHLTALVLADRRGHTLLVREANEYFSRMWQFPAAGVVRSPLQAAKALAGTYAQVKGVPRGTTPVPLAPAGHAVTFRKITLYPFLLRVRRLPNHRAARAVLLEDVATLAVSSATRKIAARALAFVGREPQADSAKI